jgi:hypothetical protein
MLVATAGGSLVSPAHLIKAWWPSGVAAPNGTIEEKCLAVWSIIAEKVDYCFDEHQREASHECWLPSQETWQRAVGDCEDHSILLASMLTHLGINAWLVWGKTDGGGHAWVEVEIDGDLKLIEATLKQPLPASLPKVTESSSAYSSVYQPDAGSPARTNGKTYAVFENGQWHEANITEAII